MSEQRAEFDDIRKALNQFPQETTVTLRKDRVLTLVASERQYREAHAHSQELRAAAEAALRRCATGCPSRQLAQPPCGKCDECQTALVLIGPTNDPQAALIDLFGIKL